MSLQDRQASLQRAKDLQMLMRKASMEIVETDPWVPITLRGDTFRLEYSYGAVTELFAKSGKVVNLMSVEIADLLTPEMFPMTLLAGLRTHHSDVFGNNSGDPMKELDIEADLMRRVPMKHVMYVHSCIQEAIKATQPDTSSILELLGEQETGAKEEDAAPLAQDSTSQDSGVNVKILDFPGTT